LRTGGHHKIRPTGTNSIEAACQAARAAALVLPPRRVIPCNSETGTRYRAQHHEETLLAETDIASLLALDAALFIAISDVLHQRSAHEVTDEPVGNIRLIATLLRDPHS
jgi:hypothetical protein